MLGEHVVPLSPFRGLGAIRSSAVVLNWPENLIRHKGLVSRLAMGELWASIRLCRRFSTPVVFIVHNDDRSWSTYEEYSAAMQQTETLVSGVIHLSNSSLHSFAFMRHLPQRVLPHPYSTQALLFPSTGGRVTRLIFWDECPTVLGFDRQGLILEAVCRQHSKKFSGVCRASFRLSQNMPTEELFKLLSHSSAIVLTQSRLNSGSMFLAHALRAVVFAPSTPEFREVRTEVGSERLRLFQSVDDLWDMIRSQIFRSPAHPQLGQRTPRSFAVGLRDFYRQLG